MEIAVKPKISVSNRVKNIIIPKYKNLKSKPSRKIGKINAKKTNAEPGSGWRVIRVIGTRIITPTIKISRVFFRSVWIILKNFARNKAVHNFANSVGWKLIGPIIYQDLAPPLSAPKMNRLDNSIAEIKYKNGVIVSKNSFLVKIIIYITLLISSF